MKRFTPIVTAAFGLSLSAAVFADNNYTFRTVVKTGDPVPLLGGNYINFITPSINGAGQVAFYGTRNADIGSISLWIADPDHLVPHEFVMASHTQAPDLPPGTVFGTSLGFFELNESGNVAFSIEVLGLPGNSRGLFRTVDSQLQKVIASGDPAPGIGNGVAIHNLPLTFGFNNSNLMAFTCTLSGPGVNVSNDTAVYMHWFGGLNLVKRKGSPAPPIGNGWTWGTSSLNTVQIADTGRVVFPSQLHTAAGERISRWSGWPGLLSHGLIGGNFSPEGWPYVDQEMLGLAHTIMTEEGYAFRHRIDVNGSSHVGIWLYDGMSNHTVALQGTAGPLGIYDSFQGVTGTTKPSVAFDGSVAFRARFVNLDESADTAVILKRPNMPASVIAQEGQQAAGYAPGVVYKDMLPLYLHTIVDEAGRVFFTAEVDGPGIDSSNNTALYLALPGGEVRQIVRRGQWVTLDDGIARQVKLIQFTVGEGLHTGRRHSVNSYGEFAMKLVFVDDTQAIVVAETPTCKADLNGDGYVDVSDLLILLSSWGPCVGCQADLAKNGVVDVSDLLVLLSAWGACD